MLAAFNEAIAVDNPAVWWRMDDASGLPQDSSGNGRNATSAAVTTYRSPFHPCSDGLGSVYMAATAGIQRSSCEMTATNDFSFELWFRLNAAPGANSQFFMYNGSGGGSGYGMLIDISRDFQGLLGGVGTTGYVTPLATGTWNHIVLERRSSDNAWGCWLNKVYYSLASAAAPIAPSGIVTMDATNLQGWWSNLALYSTRLTQARVEAHYDAAVSTVVTGVPTPGRMRARRTSW